MSNLRIIFLNPWLLLLLIPAIALALWLYLRLSKKYRRTRNRIVSVILQILVLVLSASVLSGLTFAYEEPDLKNEMILLVDVSHSMHGNIALEENSKASAERKNEFVKAVLDESGSIFRIGIVIFARNPVYAAELSYDTPAVYEKYLAALDAERRPDSSSTDIAAALTYAKDLFKDKESGRIVLISDGIETDGNALSAVMTVAAEGVRVDTVRFPAEHDAEVQIIDIVLPDYNVIAGEKTEIGVTVKSSYALPEGKTFNITLYDNDEKSVSAEAALRQGVETLTVEHTFKKQGYHKLCFVIESDADTLAQNNTFYSYIYLDVYDRILIIEKKDEAAKLEPVIKDSYDNTEKADERVKIINMADAPSELNASGQNPLREYDQIILMNINGRDMSDGFYSLLREYVYEYGGGLLTVGGDKLVLDDSGDESTVPDGYSRTDMVDTILQQMLPVNCIDYTPPIAVMIVVDASGSMMRGDVIDLAKDGAKACLEVLTDRDWVGIISFSDTAKIEIGLTPITQKGKIIDAIDGIKSGGGTKYIQAISLAGAALQAQKLVERKHIIFVSDGEPQDTRSVYESYITHYYEEAGITLSGIGIGSTVAAATIEKMAELGHSEAYVNISAQDLPELMLKTLQQPMLRGYVPESFTPEVKSKGATEMAGIDTELPRLGGFYGTRLKTGAEVILAWGEYAVPVYAKWTYGKGKVGSFLSSLDGGWADEFLSNENGVRFIHNIIKGLSPAADIRARDIDVKIEDDNYIKQLSIISQTPLSDGDTINITVNPPPNQDAYTFKLGESGRASLVVSSPGVYEITVQKANASGNPIGKAETFRTTFSYSAEYNVFSDDEASVRLLTSISQLGKGKGAILSDAEEVFLEIDTVLKKRYNPRIAFIITALILFLIDIAVRKFKFKWPWEIISDRKIKKVLIKRAKTDATQR